MTTYLKTGAAVSTWCRSTPVAWARSQAAFGSDAVSAVEVTIVNASIRYKKCYTNRTRFACGGGKPVDRRSRAPWQ